MAMIAGASQPASVAPAGQARRALNGASLAHALHDGYTDLISSCCRSGRPSSGSATGARRSARPLRRRHGRAADAERAPGRALSAGEPCSSPARCWPRSATRWRACPAGFSALCAALALVGRRLRARSIPSPRRPSPMPMGRRARPARRLQLRRRPRQGGAAGARRAAPHLHAVASGPVAARPRRSPYGRGGVGDGAALRRRRAGRPEARSRPPAAAASVSSSPSACSTPACAWAS